MSSTPFPELTSSHQPTDTDIDRSTLSHGMSALGAGTSGSVNVPSTSVVPKAHHAREPPPSTSSLQGPHPPSGGSSPSKKLSPGSPAIPQPIPPAGPQRHPNVNSTFNPLIYGNDVDSVDVATRIAMVLNINVKMCPQYSEPFTIIGNFIIGSFLQFCKYLSKL